MNFDFDYCIGCGKLLIEFRGHDRNLPLEFRIVSPEFQKKSC